jgi:hypothetical protein
MAQQNRISITIPNKEMDEALKHIADAKAILQKYLQPLTIAERQGLVKMGDKSQPFVQKALDYATTNAEFAPKTIDINEWRKDYDGVEDLTPVKNQLAQFLSDVDDTVMLLGVEAYDPARWYYNNVQFAAEKGDAGAKPIYEDLSKRFPGVSRKKKSEGTP